MLAADVEEMTESLVKTLEFGLIFIGSIFELLEGTGWVDVVARIDTYLFNYGGSYVGYVGVEVNVGTQRYMAVAALGKPCLDVAEVLGFACALSGKAHELAASLNDANGLLDAACGIHGGTGSHRLNGYGGSSSYGELADVYGVGSASGHIWGGISSV